MQMATAHPRLKSMGKNPVTDVLPKQRMTGDLQTSMKPPILKILIRKKSNMAQERD